MQRISPCLWFDDQAEEAARFYTSVFKNSRINQVSRYSEGMEKPAGTVLVVDFTLDGQDFTALNGGPTFHFSEAISLQFFCADQAEVDEYWARLTEGGEESQCGWLKDRYGLSWQIIPSQLREYIASTDAAAARRAYDAIMPMRKIDLAVVAQAYENG